MSVRQGASGPLVEDHAFFAILQLQGPNVAQEEYMLPLEGAVDDGQLAATLVTVALRVPKRLLARKLTVQQRTPATTGAPLTGRLLTYKLVKVDASDFTTVTDTLLTLDVDATDGTVNEVFLTSPVSVLEGEFIALAINHPALGAGATDAPDNIFVDLEFSETGLA